MNLFIYFCLLKIKLYDKYIKITGLQQKKYWQVHQ